MPGRAPRPGARCTVKARFAPTAAGPHTATALIADDAPGAPQWIALGGALGIAILGSVGLAVYRTRVQDALPAGLTGGGGMPRR